MPVDHHTLRVALVWDNSICQEQTFTRTSPPVVTVGDAEANHFVCPSEELPSTYEMFEREARGYTIRYPETLEGTITLDGDTYTLEQLIEKGRARPVDTIARAEGRRRVYELSMSPGDWGLIQFEEVNLYMQVLGRPAVVAGRGLRGLDWPVVGTIALAALMHAIFLIVACLAFEVTPELTRHEIPDQFAQMMVREVEDPRERKTPEAPSEETTAKKAGGKEGTFGEKNHQKEPQTSETDGPMNKEVDVDDIGVNKMLASKKLGSGPLKNMFGHQDGFDSKMKVAMSGEGGQLQVGRGEEGMGLRGSDPGGGGDGFGRVGGLGAVPGEGGHNTGAELTDKELADVDPELTRGQPTSNDLCDKNDIRTVVQAKSSAIQYCYERQLRTNPSLEGKIVSQWKIGLDGSVRTASIVESTLDNSKVESCIVRTLERMRFERPDGGICVVNYPFVFSHAP